MRRQIVELERLDVRERAGGLEAWHRRNRRVCADVDEHPIADQHARAAIVEAHLQRLRGHEPARTHDELHAALGVIPKMRGDLRMDHLALALTYRHHVDCDASRLRAVLGAAAHQRCDLRALDLVLAGQAVDVGTGAPDPTALHDGRPSTRARHVPREEFAARAAAENQDLESFHLRHGFLRAPDIQHGAHGLSDASDTAAVPDYADVNLALRTLCARRTQGGLKHVAEHARFRPQRKHRDLDLGGQLAIHEISRVGRILSGEGGQRLLPGDRDLIELLLLVDVDSVQLLAPLHFLPGQEALPLDLRLGPAVQYAGFRFRPGDL